MAPSRWPIYANSCLLLRAFSRNHAVNPDPHPTESSWPGEASPPQLQEAIPSHLLRDPARFVPPGAYAGS